ncbi:hypothetical protein BGS_0286 [Beggiatoa sp. SS]|nr:hypothetical protein BGS_0286 [Beggiatoa sp. SS]
MVLAGRNAAVIQQLCNRVVWIEDGVSKSEGETATVLTEYQQFLHLI